MQSSTAALAMSGGNISILGHPVGCLGSTAAETASPTNQVKALKGMPAVAAYPRGTGRPGDGHLPGANGQQPGNHLRNSVERTASTIADVLPGFVPTSGQPAVLLRDAEPNKDATHAAEIAQRKSSLIGAEVGPVPTADVRLPADVMPSVHVLTSLEEVSVQGHLLRSILRCAVGFYEYFANRFFCFVFCSVLFLFVMLKNSGILARRGDAAASTSTEKTPAYSNPRTDLPVASSDCNTGETLLAVVCKEKPEGVFL
jgi:hypothetical protein